MCSKDTGGVCLHKAESSIYRLGKAKVTQLIITHGPGSRSSRLNHCTRHHPDHSRGPGIVGKNVPVSPAFCVPLHNCSGDAHLWEETKRGQRDPHHSHHGGTCQDIALYWTPWFWTPSLQEMEEKVCNVYEPTSLWYFIAVE